MPMLGIITVGNGVSLVGEGGSNAASSLMEPIAYDALTRTYYGIRTQGVIAKDAFGVTGGMQVSVFPLLSVPTAPLYTYVHNAYVYIYIYI